MQIQLKFIDKIVNTNYPPPPPPQKLLYFIDI